MPSKFRRMTGREAPLFQFFVQILALLRTQAIAERARWPLWLPVLLGCGIGLYFALPVEPPLAIAWLGAGLFAGLAGLYRHQGQAGRAIWLAGGCALLLGVGVAGLRTWWVAAPVLPREIGPVSVSGQIAQLEVQSNGLRVTLESLTVQGLAPDKTPRRVRVTLRGTQPDMAAGDWLRLRAKLSPPSRPAAPGAFDFQRQSYFQGLGGVGFSFGPGEVIGRAPEQGVASLGFALQRLRLNIAERVRAHISGPVGEVAVALTTGARGAIPDEILDAMRASGLAHLLAISGLHVGLVAGIVFASVRASLALVPPFALRHPIKKWAAGCAIAGALFYALIAGATVPTQRAFLMVALVLVAVMADRRALSMRSVAWAALAILLIAPESLLGASFQLSFAAVVALIAVYETLSQSRWLHARDGGVVRDGLRYIGGVAITTLVAGLATAAFAAFHFNRVADYSLAANLLAVPITAMWIMPWAVLAFALMPLGLESLALVPMGWGIEVVLRVAGEVASWPGSQRLIPAFPTWGLALFTLGGVWAAIWRGHWRRWGALPAVLGLSAVLWMDVPDVLIDASGQLAAVKTRDGGYRVSSLSTKRFERDVWLRRAGLDTPEGRWPKAEAGGTEAQGRQAVRCDALGCVYEHADIGQVAFVKAPEALAEDCASARVVVDLSTPAHGVSSPCTAKVRIGLADLAQNGTHALTFENHAVRIETVRDRRGERPWVLP